jgi:hypothetical protein
MRFFAAAAVAASASAATLPRYLDDFSVEQVGAWLEQHNLHVAFADHLSELRYDGDLLTNFLKPDDLVDVEAASPAHVRKLFQRIREGTRPSQRDQVAARQLQPSSSSGSGGGDLAGYSTVRIQQDNSAIVLGKDADVVLKRAGPGQLSTDSSLAVGGVTLNDNTALAFGTAADVVIERSPSGELSTDSSLVVGGGAISFGTAADVVLQRSASGKLSTDSSFIVGGGAISFGTAADAALERSGPSELSTESALLVRGVDVQRQASGLGFGDVAWDFTGGGTYTNPSTRHYLKTATDFVLPSTGFTIELWVYPPRRAPSCLLRRRPPPPASRSLPRASPQSTSGITSSSPTNTVSPASTTMAPPTSPSSRPPSAATSRAAWQWARSRRHWAASERLRPSCASAPSLSTTALSARRSARRPARRALTGQTPASSTCGVATRAAKTSCKTSTLRYTSVSPVGMLTALQSRPAARAPSAASARARPVPPPTLSSTTRKQQVPWAGSSQARVRASTSK